MKTMNLNPVENGRYEINFHTKIADSKLEYYDSSEPFYILSVVGSDLNFINVSDQSKKTAS